ncbi:MAG: nickel pincer cofactor biosynthesis protein LarC [Oscillospiraceae bacterium]|nr:nickel pincer cofactor biosynthesis protein LarC [Oscillospiraceae bacterium]
MKILYLDCGMGAAGDMLMSAMAQLLPDPQAFVEKMNHLHLAGTTFNLLKVQQCGIQGVRIEVKIQGQEEISEDVTAEQLHHHFQEEPHTHEHIHEHAHTTDVAHTHTHNTLDTVQRQIKSLELSEKVKENACAVYTLLAQAEAAVHNTAVGEVHFHEVGTLDAIADVVGCCVAMEMLSPDEVVASAVHVGSGYVRCAHGVLPVPAPATAQLLTGIPIYGGTIQAELCTPTGAALLKYFVTRFAVMPPMQVNQIGYGMGKKQFETLNCVRSFLGTTQNEAEAIAELTCNLDDMTGEAVGAAMQLLLSKGALDVFFTPIQMKKNRPAVMLTVLCQPQQRFVFEQLLLIHTTTLGVRSHLCQRHVLQRSFVAVQTPYGTINVKVAQGDGVKKLKPEYEEVTAASAAHQVSFDTVYQSVMQALQK